MLPRLLRFLRLALATLPLVSGAVACAQTQASEPPALQVTGLGAGLVPLGGKWQFHTGDDPAWSSPAFNDSAWEQVVTSKGIGEQGHYAYAGYSWYRRHIDIRPVPGVTQDLAILLNSYYGPCEIFWNGHTIGHTGRMPPNPYQLFRPAPSSFALPGGSGVLAIRMWRAPFKIDDIPSMTGLDITPVIGPSDAIAAETGALDHIWLRDRQVYFDINLLYGLVGILGMILWVRNRGHKLLFWISLYTLMQFAHTLLYNAHFPLHQSFSVGFNHVTDTLGDVALWYLLLHLLELDTNLRLRRWARRFSLINLGCAFLSWLVLSMDWSTSAAPVYQVADGVFNGVLFIVPAFAFVIVAFALRKRLALANWLVATGAMLIEFVSVVSIGTLQGARFTHWHTVYEVMRMHLFTLRGNYFDPQNIASIFLLLAILYAVYCYAIQQNARQVSLEQEFKSAQEVQRILIPETLPPLPGYAVTSAYLPAQEVGGDFFQVFHRPAGFSIIVVGDVSGKGLKAAMSVSLIIGSLRAIVDVFHDPAEILSRLNHRLYGRMQGGFATCVVLRLDRDGTCTIANAGHLAPFLNCDELETPPALPLGMTNTADYDCATVTLKVDDRLTLYTDGLLEARNKAGELYGFDRVNSLIATCPDAHQASEAAIAFGQEDDITILTVTRLAYGVQSTTSLKAPDLVPATA